MKIKLAGHVFDIENRYSYITQLVNGYQSEEAAEIRIGVTDQELLRENTDCPTADCGRC